MAKSLLSRFGKTAATGLIALALATGIGVGKARAETINWGTSTPSTDIVFDWQPYGGQSSTLSSGNVNISNDANGQSISSTTAWSLIYIGEFSGGQAEVGIMNGAGNNGSGFYSTPGPLYGMPDISTLFVNNGTYVGAVDVNGNGRFGTYDTETGTFIPEAHEIMSGINVTYENDHFNVTGSYYDPVPEPVTGGLLIAGAAAALTRRRRYNSKK